jgi:hypothetical protein
MSSVEVYGSKLDGGARRRLSKKSSKKSSKNTSRRSRRMSGGAKRRSKKSSKKTSRRSRHMSGGAKRRSKKSSKKSSKKTSRRSRRMSGGAKRRSKKSSKKTSRRSRRMSGGVLTPANEERTVKLAMKANIGRDQLTIGNLREHWMKLLKNKSTVDKRINRHISYLTAKPPKGKGLDKKSITDAYELSAVDYQAGENNI